MKKSTVSVNEHVLNDILERVKPCYRAMVRDELLMSKGFLLNVEQATNALVVYSEYNVDCVGVRFDPKLKAKDGDIIDACHDTLRVACVITEKERLALFCEKTIK